MDWSLFHFLRPWWLLVLLPALALLAYKPAVDHARSAWRKAIDPHLLPHVTYAGEKIYKNFFDRCFLTLFLIGLSLALAGPTVEKKPEQSSFSKAPLVVLFELSPHMLAADLTPSRLRLAQLKLRELVQPGDMGDATLIVFAGDAHVVVPSTKDYNTLLSLSDTLSPDMMPIPGANLQQALELASKTALDGAKKIVVISSSNIDNSAQEIASYVEKNNIKLVFWTYASAQGAPLPKPDGTFQNDRGGNIIISARKDEFLGQLAHSPHVAMVTASIDSSDLASIKAELASQFQENKLEQSLPYDQWQDLGPYFLAAACVLFFIGFFTAKEQWWLLSFFIILASPPSEAVSFRDWYLRDDQKAYQALKNHQEKEAAALYHDDFSKGTAYFKAGMYDEAIEHLKKVNTPDGLYNLGNAYAHKSMVKEAIAAYDDALKKDPNHGDAKHNKEILEKLLEEQEKQQEKKPDQDQKQQQNQDQKDQEKPEQKDQEQQENKGQGSNDNEQKPGPSQKNDEEKSDDKSKEAADKPQEKQQVDDKKEMDKKQASDTKEEPKLDANTLYYFDKLEKNNNHYLKRKFLYESRKNKGVNK